MAMPPFGCAQGKPQRLATVGRRPPLAGQPGYHQPVAPVEEQIHSVQSKRIVAAEEKIQHLPYRKRQRPEVVQTLSRLPYLGEAVTVHVRQVEEIVGEEGQCETIAVCNQ